MPKSARTLLHVARTVLVALLVVAAGCSGGASSNSVPPDGVIVTVAPTSATLAPSGQQLFVAAVTGTADTTVTWQVSQGCGTVTTGGLYTAPSATASCQVVVTSNADTTKGATALVTVQDTTPPPPGTMTWEALKVGAGGWVTGMDIARSTTDPTRPVIVGRCDTYGGYVGNGVDPWRQVMTSTSMPADQVAGWRHGTPGSPAMHYPWLASGVIDIAIAPSNTNVIFAVMGGSDTTGRMYRSVDQGATWEQAGPNPGSAGGFDPGGTQPNGGDPERLTGQHIAVDPVSPAVVYAGVSGQLYVSVNANAASAADIRWAQVLNGGTALSPPTTSGGWGGIVFDRTGGTSGGRTTVVYVMSNGRGLYRGTWNGGSGQTTWASLFAGGPSQGYGGHVDHTGAYWTTVPHGNTAHRIARGSTSWTTYTGPGGADDLKGVLVDPGDANRILILDGNGDFALSTNGGASWTRGSHTRDAAGDITWFANAVHASMAYGGQTFGWDPVDAATRPAATDKKIWVADGLGFWWTNAPSTGGQQVTYHAKSAGIEQLVTSDVVVPPGNPYVYLANHDRNTFRVLRDNSAYPSTYASVQMGTQDDIVNAWGVDYSRLNSNHLAMAAAFFSDSSGYTLDGGATWTRFPTQPGGAWQIAVPSIDNILAVNGDNGSLLRSTNRGVSWSAPVSGAPASITGGGMYAYNPARRIAIDGGYNGTSNRIIYIYAYQSGLYRSTDDGATWTRLSSRVFDRGNIPKLRSVPGRPGELFFTASYASATNDVHPQGWGDAALFHVTGADAAAPGSLTWTKVTGFDNAVPGDGEPSDLAFGAKATPGQPYPTIYVAGFRGWGWGIYRSTDFNPAAHSATWEKLSDWPRMWNNGTAGNLDNVYSMGASMDTYGELYVGFQGSGWAQGTVR